ncbi:response regulator transcription factor [Solimonas marina]|uniref:Response regulator transcription factor n=1 Tax=Solimonas marina TaxID=2714601 RepID=A0A969W9J1_9GAMM|nr:response regulator transcription factor [Solimonas marina]NKF22857.1 response regulator transcription factor [Solimonas marina]
MPSVPPPATHRVPPSILIADDDEELCQLLADLLRDEGFEVETVHDGDSVLGRLAAECSPDLLILDVTMPGTDGLQALRELRAYHPLPVIMLSAHGALGDRVVGLDAGADDYLAKPCPPRELLARIRAQLRRQTMQLPDDLTLGSLQLDVTVHRACVDGCDLRLTAAEFRLLLALTRRAGRVVGKAELTRAALGREIERYDRSLDVHVSRVRRKLQDASLQAPRIEAVRGSGYRLVSPADSESPMTALPMCSTVPADMVPAEPA